MSEKQMFGVLVRAVGVLVFLEGLRVFWFALAQWGIPTIAGITLAIVLPVWGTGNSRATRFNNDSMASVASASRLVGETANYRSHRGMSDGRCVDMANSDR